MFVLPLRLAKWSFEELSNNQTGTYHSTSNQPPLASSSPALGSGILYLNKAVSFNAVGDRLIYREMETNGFANLSLRRGSLMFWFKSASGPGTTARLLEIGTRGDTNSGYWGLYLNTNMFFESYTNGSGGTNLTVSASGLTNGSWHHIALTWTPTNCSLWCNATNITNMAATIYHPGPAVRREGFSLGNSADGANPINGAFDELSTFNYPLSESEITNHFYYTRPRQNVPGLLLWLDADVNWTNNSSGTNGLQSWGDLSGHGRTFVAQSSTDRPFQIPNVINDHGVMRFDGIDDAMQRASLPVSSHYMESFMVLKSGRTPGETNGLWLTGGGGNCYYPHGHEIWDTFGCAQSSTIFKGEPPTDAGLLTSFHLYGVTIGTQGWSNRLNGLAYMTRRQPEAIKNDLGPVLGQTGSSTNQHFQGDIAEWLIYTNRPLTAGDRFAISTGLNYRYRLLTMTPDAPSNLVAQAVSSNQIMLTWDGSMTNHGINYVIEKRIGQSGASVQVINVMDDTSFLDTGLAENTTYYYRIRAVNFWNESTWVEASAATTNTAEMPLTDMKLWLRADAGALRHTTNHTVPIWLSQVGTNDATQTTFSGSRAETNQPAYGKIEVNGHPALGFNLLNDANGTNDFLQITNFASVNTEVYIVHQAVVSNGATQGFWDFGSGLHLHNTRYTNQFGLIVDNFASSAQYSTNVSAINLSGFHLYRVVSKTNDWRNYINDSLLFAPGTTNTPSFPSTPTFGRSRSGNDSSAYIFFSGRIAEVLIFQPPLSTDQTTTVQNYLKTKYNLW